MSFCEAQAVEVYIKPFIRSRRGGLKRRTPRRNRRNRQPILPILRNSVEGWNYYRALILVAERAGTAREGCRHACLRTGPWIARLSLSRFLPPAARLAPSAQLFAFDLRDSRLHKFPDKRSRQRLVRGEVDGPFGGGEALEFLLERFDNRSRGE